MAVRSRRASPLLRAAADDAAAAAPSTSGSSSDAFAAPMPALAWPVDKETPREVFAVNGPLAEVGVLLFSRGARQEALFFCPVPTD